MKRLDAYCELIRAHTGQITIALSVATKREDSTAVNEKLKDMLEIDEDIMKCIPGLFVYDTVVKIYAGWTTERTQTVPQRISLRFVTSKQSKGKINGLTHIWSRRYTLTQSILLNHRSRFIDTRFCRINYFSGKTPFSYCW